MAGIRAKIAVIRKKRSAIRAECEELDREASEERIMIIECELC